MKQQGKCWNKALRAWWSFEQKTWREQLLGFSIVMTLSEGIQSFYAILLIIAILCSAKRILTLAKGVITLYME